MAVANRSKPITLDATLGTLLAPNGVDWAGKAHIVGIHLANTGTTDCDAFLALRRGSVDYFFLYQKTIPAGESLLLTTHLILETGDLLRGRGSIANQIHAVMSGLEGVA